MLPVKLSQKWEYVNKVIHLLPIMSWPFPYILRAHNHLGTLLSIFIIFCSTVEPEATRILFFCIWTSHTYLS